MDHLTSRFRRTAKRDSPVSQNPSIPERQAARPSLIIETSPSSTRTTPPGSSYDAVLPQSPFRGFNQLHISRTTGQSPASAQSTVPNTMASLSPVNGTTIVSAAADKNRTAKEKCAANKTPQSHTPSEKPWLPPFLRVSDSTVLYRFQELIWLERLRTQRGAQDPSPYFRFARTLPPEAKALDRYVNIQPWANNRVHLAVPEGKLDYINASPIISPSPLRPSSRVPLKYIAMQGPKWNTVDHTWRMVAQLQSPVVIVMLTDTHEGQMEKCFPYFPITPQDDSIEVGETDEFEDGFRGRVDCISMEERQDGAVQMRKLNLHIDNGGEMTVWHLLYRKWPDFGVPKVEDYDSFYELMNISRELNTRASNPRIIHCSAGVGRTGTFIALETLLREVDDGAMDYLNPQMDGNNDDLVFRTVNALREQRRTMVQADSQYAFIYKVLRRRWMARHGLLEDATENERAYKRKYNRPPMGQPTVGQPRKTRRVQPRPQFVDNYSSDDSTQGGAPLGQMGN
ncbi:hypothetical protein GGR50DRAFT_697376 [Xylaria sp. CBS 124048]|nr:hypothetical protein GGR50DRAFT_697376 [Xylaria sp. CBS 124048]